MADSLFTTLCCLQRDYIGGSNIIDKLTEEQGLIDMELGRGTGDSQTLEWCPPEVIKSEDLCLQRLARTFFKSIPLSRLDFR